MIRVSASFPGVPGVPWVPWWGVVVLVSAGVPGVPGVPVWVGFSECWPKKKPGQNGPSKNGQFFWPAGQKNHSFFTILKKKRANKFCWLAKFFSWL